MAVRLYPLVPSGAHFQTLVLQASLLAQVKNVAIRGGSCFLFSPGDNCTVVDLIRNKEHFLYLSCSPLFGQTSCFLSSFCLFYSFNWPVTEESFAAASGISDCKQKKKKEVEIRFFMVQMLNPNSCRPRRRGFLTCQRLTNTECTRGGGFAAGRRRWMVNCCRRPNNEWVIADEDAGGASRCSTLIVCVTSDINWKHSMLYFWSCGSAAMTAFISVVSEGLSPENRALQPE